MALPEYRILETAKLALADLRETYPEIPHIPIDLDRGTRRMGATHFRGGKPTKVTLSRHLNDPVAVDDTMRHEVAHWMAGYDAHHGPRWQHWARKCGTSPTTCSQHGGAMDVPQRPGLTLECPSPRCDMQRIYQKDCKSLRYFRRGGEGRCRKCGYSGLFRVY